MDTAAPNRPRETPQLSPALDDVLPPFPRYHGDITQDAAGLNSYVEDCAELVLAAPAPAERSAAQSRDADGVEQAARHARHCFLRLHADAVYTELTEGHHRRLRLDTLASAARERYPGLLSAQAPARAAADHRVSRPDRSREEIDEGIFFAHVLDRSTAGGHLIESMLAPTQRALDLLPDFLRTGRVDLGRATVHRDGFVAEVTICNQDVLNAEDDAVVEALETAVDLALLDDTVSVGVLRGGVLTHPRYRGRRAFGAGINLTHLHDGRISFLDFMLRRELGYIRKLIHGLHHGPADGFLQHRAGKPWVGAVETFAIGGATQVALVLDRVIADADAYFSLPALAEGIVPGAANLRLGRVAGRRMAQRLIFFGDRIAAASPEARELCDEVVAPEEIGAALESAAEQLADPAVPANRRMLHLAEESDDLFRAYMSRYALEQSGRMHSPDVLARLERTWIRRRAGGRPPGSDGPPRVLGSGAP